MLPRRSGSELDKSKQVAIISSIYLACLIFSRNHQVSGGSLDVGTKLGIIFFLPKMELQITICVDFVGVFLRGKGQACFRGKSIVYSLLLLITPTDDD